MVLFLYIYVKFSSLSVGKNPQMQLNTLIKNKLYAESGHSTFNTSLQLVPSSLF